MLIMPSNNSGLIIGYLAGRYSGSLGHLYSPGGQRGPYRWMPYALDNGAFSAFSQNKQWEIEPWLKLLDWAKKSNIEPLWVLVPDVVGDRDGTLKAWDLYSPIVKEYGFKLAFAAQDGMVFADVPKDADIVFIGGSTQWKRESIIPWAKNFKRVHVGRVNTYRWLCYCADAGVESVDGTGWLRGDKRQLAGLVQFLKEQSGEIPRQDEIVISLGELN